MNQNKIMELRINNNGILTSVWLNGGDKNLIYASGLPQYVTKHHPIVKLCQNFKVNLFVPRYKGSWESDGDFTIAGSIYSIKETIKMVRGGKTIELYNDSKITWDGQKIFLMGSSFGGIPAIFNKEEVYKTILVNPLINFSLHRELSTVPFEKNLDFLLKAFKNVYRFEKSNLIKELENLEYLGQKNNLVLIRGSKDNVISKGEIEWIKNKFNPDYLEIVDGEHSLKIPDDIFKKVFEIDIL